MKATPKKFKGQTILFLYTEKAQETQSFCEDILGLPLILDQGNCRIYQTGTDAYLGYCDRKEAREKNGIIVTLIVDDVDGWYQNLQHTDVKVIKEPSINECFGIYHFFIEDPNGYLFEFQRFIEPFPPDVS